MNHGNIARARTSSTELRERITKQKHAARIIFHEEEATHTRPLLKEIHALKIY